MALFSLTRIFSIFIAVRIYKFPPRSLATLYYSDSSKELLLTIFVTKLNVFTWVLLWTQFFVISIHVVTVFFMSTLFSATLKLLPLFLSLMP